MAKYNWAALEKEYILSEHKSVSAFLKDKGILNNAYTRRMAKGWKEKKSQNSDKKLAKTIEKIIEKQSNEDAKTLVKFNDVANKLLEKINKATEELTLHMDMFGNLHNGIVDRGDVKKLTSALKDIKDVLPQKNEDEEDNSFINALNGKVEEIWDEEE